MRFQRRPQTLHRLTLTQRPPRALTLRFRRLRPILHQQKVVLARFQHHPLTLHRPMFLPRRLRMHPVRLPLLHPLTLTQRRPRMLMMWFRRFPLTLRRLRFQRRPLLTLTRHRLRVPRLTFHPLTLAPITSRRARLRLTATVRHL